MNFCPSFGFRRIRFCLFILLAALFANGCSDDTAAPSSSNESDTNTAASNDVTNSESPSNTKGGSNNSDADAPRTGNSDAAMVANGYAPIFTKGLEQNMISSRMENNFNIFFQKNDKSELHHFKSAGLRMLKPEGFELAAFHTGFKAKGVNMTLLTNPFSMKETTDNIIAEAMNQRNSGILFLKDVNIDGYDGKFYVNVDVLSEDVVTANYTLAFGDNSYSWIIKGTFLTTDEMKNRNGENVVKSLLSTRVADEPRAPAGEDVDFTIRPNILKLNDGFIDKVVFTKNGTFPVDRTDQPIFQASRIPKRIRESDRKQFAEMMISPTPLFKIELVSSQSEVEIDGLPGTEFVALGKDTVSNEPLQIFTVVVFDGEFAYVMNGWVSSLNMDNHVKDFRELTRSFRRKKQSNSAGDG